MKKRLFLAIAADPGLCREVEEFSASHPEFPVRWLSGKNLHITLLPPWQDGDLGKTISDIQKRIPTGREINMIFDNVSFGPNAKDPRLIWAEGGAPRSLVTLKEELEEVLDMPPERPGFRMHLTLARFRPEEFSGFEIKELGERVDWQMRTAQFVLMESRLLPDGAEYEILHKFQI